MPGPCARCGRKVFAAEEKLALGKSWHLECFTCGICNRSLNSVTLAENRENSEIYCKACYQRVFATKGYGYGPLEPTLLVMDCPNFEQVNGRDSKAFEPPPSRLGHTYSSTCSLPLHHQNVNSAPKAQSLASARRTSEEDQGRKCNPPRTPDNSFDDDNVQPINTKERNSFLKNGPKSKCEPPCSNKGKIRLNAQAQEASPYKQNNIMDVPRDNAWIKRNSSDKTNQLKKEEEKENKDDRLVTLTEGSDENCSYRCKFEKSLTIEKNRWKLSGVEQERKPNKEVERSERCNEVAEQRSLWERPKTENKSFNGLDGCSIGECVGTPAYPRYPPTEAKCHRARLGPNAFDRDQDQNVPECQPDQSKSKFIQPVSRSARSKKTVVKEYSGKRDICTRCGRPVFFAEMKRSYHGVYHTECYTCCSCRKPLEPTTISENQGEIFCKGCYRRLFCIHGVGFGVGSGVLQTP